MEAVLPPVGEDAADIFRHILQIPFVHKSIYLAGFFIAFVRCIGIIDNTNKTYTPNWKQTVNILFHQFQLSGKARLRLAKHYYQICAVQHLLAVC